MAWAEKTNLGLEVDHFVADLQEVNDTVAEEGATDEEQAEIDAWKKEEREHLETIISEHKVALKEA